MTENHSHPEDPSGAEGQPRFSFTDKRKVDPTDGTPRPSGSSPAGASLTGAGSGSVDPLDAEAAALRDHVSGTGVGSADPRVDQLEARVAELEDQLKREQAEYVNSRRRIENAAEAGKQNAIGQVLASLISVLDDIELGRQHGDIAEGTPFHSISQKLEDALRAHGLERYGAVGETFDPNIHDALMHQQAEDAEDTEIAMVMQPGYRMHERVLRPARVGTRGPN